MVFLHREHSLVLSWKMLFIYICQYSALKDYIHFWYPEFLQRLLNSLFHLNTVWIKSYFDATGLNKNKRSLKRATLLCKQFCWHKGALYCSLPQQHNIEPIFFLGAQHTHSSFLQKPPAPAKGKHTSFPANSPPYGCDGCSFAFFGHSDTFFISIFQEKGLSWPLSTWLLILIKN